MNEMRLVPENKSFVFEETGGYVEFEIEKIEGHQMVEIRLE